jgi:hypothetical protein
MEGQTAGSFAMEPDDHHFLHLSRLAYRESDDWFDASIRRELEDAQHRFNSEHPAWSKYHTAAFEKRSKFHRPKPRTAIRNFEAKLSVAMFATRDVIDCRAVNQQDEQQLIAAKTHKSVLNHRLTDGGVPWFKIVTGAGQLAAKDGTVLSKQTWRYEEIEKIDEVEMRDLMTGEIFTERQKNVDIREDRPDINLVPLENFRFSPSANWLDVIKTSAYLIHEEPIRVGEIKRLMDEPDTPDGVTYRHYEDGVIRAAVNKYWDSIRSAREGTERRDRYEENAAIPDYELVWRREYIMEIDGEDWIWWTLGGEFMLSDPVPMEEVYPYGRPFRMGTISIEALKVYSAGIPKLMEQLTQASNDMANLAHDNARLATLKTKIVQRNSGVDIRAYQKGVPGAVTLANSVDAVKTESPGDLPRASYEEQDRMNMDLDDLTGVMNKGTIGASRNLGETKYGAEVMQGETGMLGDFMVRTFIETWAEPVIRQLVDMESLYEQDETVLAIAAAENGTTVLEAFHSLKQDIKVKIDIGFGATSPVKRVENIMLATKTVLGVLPEPVAEKMDHREFVDDVFGAVGLDASRYFSKLMSDEEQEEEPDPMVQQLQQQLQEAQKIIDGKQIEQQGRIQVAQIGAQTNLEIANMRAQVDMQRLAVEQEWKQYEAQIKQIEKDLDRQQKEIDQLANAEEAKQKRWNLMMQKDALEQNKRENLAKYELELLKLAMASGEGDNALPAPTPKSAPATITQGPMDMPGNDAGGVMAREQFDLIPGNSM